MSDRIGFIGLGIMGRPMARNLMNAGFSIAAGGSPPVDSRPAQAHNRGGGQVSSPGTS